MRTALKPKKLSSEEENEDKIQYIEVKARKEIKDILKAEKEGTTTDKKIEPDLNQKTKMQGQDSKVLIQ